METPAAPRSRVPAILQHALAALGYLALSLVYLRPAWRVFRTHIAPDPADPWFNLGTMHAEAGDVERAMAAWDEYTKRDAGTGWAKAVRAKKAELAQRKGKGKTK